MLPSWEPPLLLLNGVAAFIKFNTFPPTLLQRNRPGPIGFDEEIPEGNQNRIGGCRRVGESIIGPSIHRIC